MTESSEPSTNVMPASLRGCARLGKAVHFVVIGQREDVDAPCGGAADDGGRREQSVGMRRMAVEVVVKHRSVQRKSLPAEMPDVCGALVGETRRVFGVSRRPRLNFAAFHANFTAAGRSPLKCDAERATICQWYSKVGPQNPLTCRGVAVKFFDRVLNPREIRRRLGMNQEQFWTQIGVTQSGGSRYESGREMPRPVKELLRLVHVEQIDLSQVKRVDFEIISYLKEAASRSVSQLAPRREAAAARARSRCVRQTSRFRAGADGFAPVTVTPAVQSGDGHRD